MKNFAFLAIFVVIIASSGICDGHECTDASHCQPVTSNENYAYCAPNHRCACFVERGFDGEGTIERPCECRLPKHEIFIDSVHYCEDVASLIKQKKRDEVLGSQATQIYKNLLGNTTSLSIAKSGSPLSSLFTPDVIGRVTPLGTFPGIIFVQYFYVFSATLGGANKLYVHELTVKGNTVAVRVDIEFSPPNRFPVPVYNFTSMGFLYFDESNRVASADLVLPNVGDLEDPIFNAVGFIPYAEQICTVIQGNPALNQTQGLCNGTNQQYANFSACMAFMASIPLGSFNRVNSNTVACRIVHLSMVILPPTSVGADIHCPHVGPTGGMMCMDFPYTSFYTDDIINPSTPVQVISA